VDRHTIMTVYRLRRPLALVAGIAVALVACSDGGGSVNPSDDAVVAIDGSTFLSESVTGREFVAGSRLRVSFADGQLGADAGCNRIGGDYSITAGQLVVDGLGMTDMACESALMDQEQWFADFLVSRPAISREGDRLTLSDEAVAVVFLDREVADPDRPLEGTVWVVVGLIEGETASSVPEGASLVFTDGTLEVQTGCNVGSAPYESLDEGAAVEIGTMGLTRVACLDDDEARLEAAILKILVGQVAVDIEAANGTFTGNGAGLMVQARD
jgi:heat shock protein HslJ